MQLAGRKLYTAICGGDIKLGITLITTLMNKNKILAPIIGCLILALSSCVSDDEAEVYLTVKPGTELDFPTSLAPEDNYVSFLDEFIQTDMAPITGHYSRWKKKGGYVDLGLSVKWASFNLNPKETIDDKDVKSFKDIYKEVMHDMSLNPDKYGNSGLNIPNAPNQTYPYVMSYEEFCKNYNYSKPESVNKDYDYRKYKEFCKNMKKAYEKAVVIYNSYLCETKYVELFNRGYYNWGGIDLYAVPSDYKDLPMNVAGTEYDWATVTLGQDWRMPTKAEFQELLNNCKWEFCSVNGVDAYIVTGPSGNRIFISIGKKYDTTDYPYIFLTSERTNDWYKGVYVYALDIDHMKIINTHNSGRKATIRPVYTK